MISGMPRIAIAVNDLDDAIATFRGKLGMPLIDLSDSSVAGLGARLAMCVPHGGSNIELMCPANHSAPLSQSLERFLARRGQGLFALMLEAPIPDEEADRLIDQGMQVLPLMAGAGGRDIHPKSAHGVLIRIYPDNSFGGQREPENESLGLSGILRVIIAVLNIDDAITVYGDKLGLTVQPVVADNIRGVKSAICRAPSGGAIELVQVEDESRAFAHSIAAFLEDRGEGMYALVLQADDPEDVVEILSRRGIRTDRVSRECVEIAPADTFDARVFIERAVDQ